MPRKTDYAVLSERAGFKPFTKAERAAVAQYANGGRFLPGGGPQHALAERMVKRGLLSGDWKNGYRLTPMGQSLLAAILEGRGSK